jgi:hypothetical protein
MRFIYDKSKRGKSGQAIANRGPLGWMLASRKRGADWVGAAHLLVATHCSEPANGMRKAGVPEG